MKINNSEVTIENGIYKYFSCTCAQEDEQFWQSVVTEVTGNTEGEQSNALIYTLSHCFDAVVTNLWADMWMGFKVSAPDKELYITTDHLHYGLTTAVVILSVLYPEKAEDYDMQGLLRFVQ